MTRITCEIPGRPIPCPRPRVTRSGKPHYSGPYDEWRDGARVLLRQACIRQNGGRLIEGPVAVYAQFVGLHGSADLDNAVKALLDAAQGQIYGNDLQVACIHAARADCVDKGVYVKFAPYEIHVLGRSE